ncbi:pseudouridine synthase [Psychromonas sp. GE-S-Ul-11]|uniref:pseudouridine synthase n=1 Tax=Psychromonas sp. GE-S-Ul-11 TaxID=3241170 RepID=UPI00390CD8F5
MRLDKFICESTELTRSEAKNVIRKGMINNQSGTLRSGAYKVAADDVIEMKGQVLTTRGFRYLMLNKPPGYISSNVDEQMPSLLNLIDIEKKQNVFIAGRLDADTTGLVLITDDGQWSHQVTSPRKKCEKRYRVHLQEPVDQSTVDLFAQGIQLKSEPQPCLPAKLELISETEVLLTISEGKYHQVKRMFSAVGNFVTKLHREQIGCVQLDAGLALGESRFLTEQEINGFK